jgi:CRISPR-associated protein (TIGR02584 family)
VAGLTPQVVTETLYALLVRHRFRGLIEVHVLTTATGRDVALKRLLDPREGAIARLCRDYRIPGSRIFFPPENIHLLRAADGRPLPDIRSAADNAAVADQIMAFVREQAARPDVVLHGSIAGGRKTMSMLLGSAFMLFGRPQDRLSHVLVSSEFESSPEFYYPPPRPARIPVAGGRTADASRARVELAEVAYPRLRNLLTPSGRQGPLRHTDLIRSAQALLDHRAHPELVVDLPAGEIRVGGARASLPPRLLAFYSLFAAEKRERCIRRDLPRCGDCAECYFSAGKNFPVQQRDRLLATYHRVLGREPQGLKRALETEKSAETLREMTSKVNAALRERLGSLAPPYLITAIGTYAKRHGLPIDKGLIQLRYPAPVEDLDASAHRGR